MSLAKSALMLLTAATSLTAQVRPDSSVIPPDSTVRIFFRTPARPNPHLLPLTAEHLRTAFRDSLSRDIVAGTRRVQNEQDAALLNYEALGYQRLSVGLSVTARGRERLAFRREGAVRVRWYNTGVAFVEVQGARAVVPIMSSQEIGAGANSMARRNMVSGSIQIPYYPGRDELWFGEGIPDADQLRFVHPFADGAESRYIYNTGDSAQYTFPDGRVTRLLELRVTPRTPDWFLVTGSFWFDRSSFRLVRAAYRPAVDLDYWDVVPAGYRREIPEILRPIITPLRGTIRAVTVEYALFHGRFWLPRSQTMEAEGQAAMMRLPLSFEQRYDYVSVNASGPAPAAPALVTGRATACDAENNRTQARRRFGGAVRVITSVTCDNTLLQNSPSLPVSIYDSDAESVARRGMLEGLLKTGLQARIAPRAPSLHFGLGDGLMRYNRVEGFSPGMGVLQEIGGGYTLDAAVRMGTADQVVNAELALSHDNGRRGVRASAYRRLSAANDWGSPLNVGSSLQALLFARDEGFYYRASGAELILSGAGNPELEFRLFAERQTGADAVTDFSIAGALGDATFQPNIDADELRTFGASVGLHHSIGVDPSEPRLMYDIRAEHSVGERTFGRALADMTLSTGRLGAASAALTLRVGSTTGDVPAQRHYFLGGTQSVRGQRPGVMSGDAFWMARGELGTASITVRPVLFADVGWAGSRGDWSRQARAASGAGVGLSLFDGLIRLDLARGVFPGKSWRFASYLEGRL